MTTALAITLAACTWASPGASPYTGTLDAAVDRYRDIPAEVRATLKRRIETRQYDELVTIRRDGITGGQYAYTGLRDMHWRDGMCAGPVVGLDRWAAEHAEGAMVFCESGHCLAWPARCRNLARVDRAERIVYDTRKAPPIEIPGGTGTASQELQIDGPAPDLLPYSAMPRMLGRSLDLPADGPTNPVDAPSFSAWSIGSPMPAPMIAGLPVFAAPGLALPDAAVVPIPEPRIWALLLAGLALVMFKVWRVQRLTTNCRRCRRTFL